MAGKFGEIDLSSDMYIQTKFIDMDGDEPEIRPVTEAFTATESNLTSS